MPPQLQMTLEAARLHRDALERGFAEWAHQNPATIIALRACVTQAPGWESKYVSLRVSLSYNQGQQLDEFQKVCLLVARLEKNQLEQLRKQALKQKYQ